MRRLFASIAPTAITVIAGIITFLSFLVPTLADFRASLVNIAVIIGGFAVVLGFVHLMRVHIQRIAQRKGFFYSVMLIVSAVAATVFLVIDRVPGLNSPNQWISNFIFNGIIVPMQSSLGALLAFFLALAAFRMIRHRWRWSTVGFLLAAIVVLLTQAPLPWLGFLVELRANLLDPLTTGGMRGLLLGVALGTIATVVRVLIPFDRPQSE